MSETTTEMSVEELREDAEARLDFLIAADVVDVDEDGGVTSTGEFENVRSIYADSYDDITDQELAEALAEVFGTSIEEAQNQIEETDLDQHDLITYLALQSHLDRDIPQDVLVLLTSMVSGVGYGSAVPETVRELDDETYAEYIEDRGDAIVFVWQYPCDPCETLKADLPDLFDKLPDAVSVAGVDGDTVGQFRQEYEITTAPTVLLFADGELAERIEGYYPVPVLVNEFAEVYEGVAVEDLDEDYEGVTIDDLEEVYEDPAGDDPDEVYEDPAGDDFEET